MIECADCGRITTHPTGVCDSCDRYSAHAAPSLLAVATALALAAAIVAVALVVAWNAAPFSGGHLIAAPLLLILAGALVHRLHIDGK